jgi:hypothetical protein
MTYHISVQILFLLALEPPQFFHDASTSVSNILLADLQSLAEMAERLLCLAEGISPCALWVSVCDALDGMRKAAEQLVRNTTSGTLVRAIGRWWRRRVVVIPRLALLCCWDARATRVGREVRID